MQRACLHACCQPLLLEFSLVSRWLIMLCSPVCSAGHAVPCRAVCRAVPCCAQALMRDCQNYFKATGRRVTFEYTLMGGTNDEPKHVCQPPRPASSLLPCWRTHPLGVDAAGSSITRRGFAPSEVHLAAVLHSENIAAKRPCGMSCTISKACETQGTVRVRGSDCMWCSMPMCVFCRRKSWRRCCGSTT